MNRISKIRWGVAAIASGIAFVAMNASAVNVKGIKATLSMVGGTNCTNPPGQQIVVLAKGYTSGGQTVCMAEASIGISAIGNCDHSGMSAPQKVIAIGGKLNTTTYVFTADGASTGPEKNWANDATSTTPVWAPVANCLTQGSAIAKN